MERDLDKARGTTDRMRRYCIEHGLIKYRDRNFIWKAPDVRYHFWGERNKTRS